MLQMMRTIVQEEGLLRPWKGMSAMALGAGPAHAMYFTCLEVGKEKAENLGLSNNIGFMVDGKLIGHEFIWGTKSIFDVL